MIAKAFTGEAPRIVKSILFEVYKESKKAAFENPYVDYELDTTKFCVNFDKADWAEFCEFIGEDANKTGGAK